MGFGRVFLFIFIFALLEAMVLGQVAQAVGWGVTILLTVLTAMLGSALFRWQGLQTWVRLNKRIQRGEMPGNEMVEGVMLLLGGALLITPGFITDGIGFLLLLPHTRRGMASYVIKKGMLNSVGTMGSAAGASGVWIHRGGATGPFSASAYGQQYRRARPEASADSDNPQVYEDGKGHLIIEGEAEKKDKT
ncbi:FxsA family protein [Ketobacter sp. MCCC 1A13808]|uniref:FxsA family protein n=1 Tax=Ketobacter sp. MCCC 1A13808 TaxID=2602738 RepID=UPI0012EC2D35|nr:FxsA family protein [Ketobacter sp. MCCC 1A13808]MVF11135.1 FxsA family protein [Ketobacter sp. MCCC 1A13808]